MSLALSDMGVAFYMLVVMVILLIGSVIAYRKEHGNRAHNEDKGDEAK